MHDTAYEIGGLFFQSYVNAESSVLEIGSLNINGGLRDFRPTGSYIWVDLNPGNGVDVIVRRISQLPFRRETFDAVVSSSCLEHDLMFWVTFLEMCRVLKHGGYLYLRMCLRKVNFTNTQSTRGGFFRMPVSGCVIGQD